MKWEQQRPYDELAQRDLAAGNFRGALDTLVRGYQHVMVGFCTNMLGDADQAEEIAQEVFLAAYTAMPRFRQHASVRTWLFAIARKQCLKALRDRRRRWRLTRQRQDAIATLAHAEPLPLPGEGRDAQLQLVKYSLGQLSNAERLVLVMRYETGLPIADMAHILGMSVTSVHRRLGRALQHLREIMDSGVR